MAYATYREQRPVDPQQQQENQSKITGKGLARIYGYMGIGLAITAAIAVLVAWFFSSRINFASSNLTAEKWFFGYIGTVIACGIGCIILSFVVPVMAASGKHSIWVPYILFTVFMGGLLSIILTAGISWQIIGEAFGISAAAFLIMFFIGYFSKKDISLPAYFLIGMLSMALLVFLFWSIFAAIGGGWQTLRTLDIIYSVIICVIMLLFIAIDGYRAKQIAGKGGATNNIYLYCAFVMYSDFISLLVRVIYLLSILQRKN